MINIKFRSWFNGEYIYWQSCDKSNWFWDTVRENDLDVEQFTGIKDKNGKEIYDGDIILLNTYSTANGIKGLYSIAKHTISHESKIYGQGNGGSSEFSGFYFNGYYGIPSEGEVVGNIHENKDLLNE